MSILITGGGSPLALALAARLAATANVVLFDDQFGPLPPTPIQTITADLRDPAAVAPALAGVESVIHLAPLTIAQQPTTADGTALDRIMRGSYVLVNAAREAGERILADRRAEATIRIFLRKPARRAVGPAFETMDILAEHHDALILRHTPVHDVSDGIDESDVLF
ncbi:MAG TPA: hypothetical protein PKE45_14285 [Caldilineaceae bacterium]|nr:hypothetical protein [Caldilineaceae bacterium]